MARVWATSERLELRPTLRPTLDPRTTRYFTLIVAGDGSILLEDGSGNLLLEAGDDLLLE